MEGGGGEEGTYFINAVDPEVLECSMPRDLLGSERGDEGEDGGGGFHDGECS